MRIDSAPKTIGNNLRENHISMISLKFQPEILKNVEDDSFVVILIIAKIQPIFGQLLSRNYGFEILKLQRPFLPNSVTP